ncbi:adenine phosphoribosyltransferase [Cellulosimicrobium cellulans]|uniref:adenine phosphoribosyltransferase n=1 Tax=Cellulosimicrobium cellulans TaxID=1710 RepID=UPI0019667614|nr:adenine phosphoribosyltransferase [Cellulosimicrobium cellulans]MBN0039968.1 adenine phosphoribosyltransferase [Cellulosimicrobium cellulans]
MTDANHPSTGEVDGLRAVGLAGLGGQRASRVLELVRAVPDYPGPGITFRDITGLLADGEAFGHVVEALGDVARAAGGIDLVAGMEARGFLIGAPLATHLGVGFVPLRKAGKLPPPVDAVTYDLEYGTATIELRSGTLSTGARVLVVDDVLATGGTAAAGAELVERGGGVVVGLAFLLELEGLGGRERLAGRDVTTLVHVES